jgi:hypothetical protein
MPDELNDDPDQIYIAVNDLYNAALICELPDKHAAEIEAAIDNAPPGYRRLLSEIADTLLRYAAAKMRLRRGGKPKQ